ncbi:MAG: hypothetical protein ACI9G1_005377, partial [Pirellulaceae bacterium]
ADLSGDVKIGDVCDGERVEVARQFFEFEAFGRQFDFQALIAGEVEQEAVEFRLIGRLFSIVFNGVAFRTDDSLALWSSCDVASDNGVWRYGERDVATYYRVGGDSMLVQRPGVFPPEGVAWPSALRCEPEGQSKYAGHGEIPLDFAYFFAASRALDMVPEEDPEADMAEGNHGIGKGVE